MDLEVAGLVRGGLPAKLPPGGQAPQTACFLSVLASCLVPSGCGHASSPQAGGLSWSSGARAPSVLAPAPRIAHGSVAWPLPRGCRRSPRRCALGSVCAPCCFEPPCAVFNLESVVLARLVFFPADKYVRSEACHGVGF